MEKINSSKRDIETTADKHNISRMWGKITTLFSIKFSATKKLKEIYKSLTHKNLENGEWPYQKYYFSGKNPLIDKESFDKGNLAMFKNIPLLEDIIQRSQTVNFDGDPKISKEVDKLAESLIKNNIFSGKNPIIDQESKNKFSTAIQEAMQNDKKIILLMNHASHFDTPIVNYILNTLIKDTSKQHPEIASKKIRFVCGAYMYYHKGVRNFTPAFNTTLVFGPKDFKEMISYLHQQKRTDLILQFAKEAIKQTQSNADSEITILFPYAGRSESLDGCKNEIPKWVESYLQTPNCSYIPIGCIGSDNIFPTGDLYRLSKNIDVIQHVKNIIKHLKVSQLINFLDPNADQKQLVKLIEKAEPINIVVRILENIDIFKLLKFLEKYKFKFFKSGEVYMTIGDAFSWWEKWIEEINEIMHSTANNALEKYQNSQKSKKKLF
jgi:hypothetical protein